MHSAAGFARIIETKKVTQSRSDHSDRSLAAAILGASHGFGSLDDDRDKEGQGKSQRERETGEYSQANSRKPPLVDAVCECVNVS